MVIEQFVDYEPSQTDDCDHEEDGDEVRRQPVFLLPFVEHDLQCGDSQRKQSDSPIVDSFSFPRNVVRIKNEERRHDQAKDAGGKASSMMAWERGCSPPPLAPCITRKRISKGRLGARPQRNEETVKPVMEAMSTRLRPKWLASHPV